MNTQAPRADVIKAHLSGTQPYVVVRCPHCRRRHYHAGGAGHRIAHCAGTRADKLRQLHGSLEYEIDQLDIDRRLGAAA